MSSFASSLPTPSSSKNPFSYFIDFLRLLQPFTPSSQNGSHPHSTSRARRTISPASFLHLPPHLERRLPLVRERFTQIQERGAGSIHRNLIPSRPSEWLLGLGSPSLGGEEDWRRGGRKVGMESRQSCFLPLLPFNPLWDIFPCSQKLGPDLPPLTLGLVGSGEVQTEHSSLPRSPTSAEPSSSETNLLLPSLVVRRSVRGSSRPAELALSLQGVLQVAGSGWEAALSCHRSLSSTSGFLRHVQGSYFLCSSLLPSLEPTDISSIG